MAKNEDSNVAYTETYMETCFQAWYQAGRPSKYAHILEVLPVDEYDKKPSRLMINKWLEMSWSFRADELDARAIEKADNNLVLQKVKMLKDQAKRGEQLQDKGMKHIEQYGFDSASAAVSAVIRGATLERESRGIGELILKMAKMSDDELKDEIMKKLQTLSDEVEGDVIEENGQRTDTESNQETDESESSEL